MHEENRRLISVRRRRPLKNHESAIGVTRFESWQQPKHKFHRILENNAAGGAFNRWFITAKVGLTRFFSLVDSFPPPVVPTPASISFLTCRTLAERAFTSYPNDPFGDTNENRSPFLVSFGPLFRRYTNSQKLSIYYTFFLERELHLQKTLTFIQNYTYTYTHTYIEHMSLRFPGTGPRGPCSLGDACTAKNQELSDLYKCRHCQKQLHGFSSGCSTPKNRNDFRAGVICKDQPCVDPHVLQQLEWAAKNAKKRKKSVGKQPQQQQQQQQQQPQTPKQQQSPRQPRQPRQQTPPKQQVPDGVAVAAAAGLPQFLWETQQPKRKRDPNAPKQKRQRYKRELKEMVVQALEDAPESTLAEVAKKFNIPPGTLRGWRDDYIKQQERKEPQNSHDHLNHQQQEQDEQQPEQQQQEEQPKLQPDGDQEVPEQQQPDNQRVQQQLEQQLEQLQEQQSEQKQEQQPEPMDLDKQQKKEEDVQSEQQDLEKQQDEVRQSEQQQLPLPEQKQNQVEQAEGGQLKQPQDEQNQPEHGQLKLPQEDWQPEQAQKQAAPPEEPQVQQPEEQQQERPGKEQKKLQQGQQRMEELKELQQEQQLEEEEPKELQQKQQSERQQEQVQQPEQQQEDQLLQHEEGTPEGAVPLALDDPAIEPTVGKNLTLPDDEERMKTPEAAPIETEDDVADIDESMEVREEVTSILSIVSIGEQRLQALIEIACQNSLGSNRRRYRRCCN